MSGQTRTSSTTSNFRSRERRTFFVGGDTLAGPSARGDGSGPFGIGEFGAPAGDVKKRSPQETNTSGDSGQTEAVPGKKAHQTARVTKSQLLAFVRNCPNLPQSARRTIAAGIEAAWRDDVKDAMAPPAASQDAPGS
jgi:hypothetical protein